jgi:sugar phosphate permease
MSEAERAPAPLTTAVLTVFLPFAGGYFLSYLYRTVNAVLAPRLVEELGIGPADLGLLTAVYFFTFAAFQLPLGVLLDRFGPRRVQALLLCFAALGAFVFSRGNGLDGLVIGRALIGLGVAGGLMASFKAITLWFPRERWALVNGCFLAMGGLGALSATAPTEYALQFTDWRGVFTILAGVTLLVALVIYFVSPEKPQESSGSLGEALKGTGEVFRDRLFWRVVPIAVPLLSYGLAVQGLWIGPYLREVGGLSSEAAAGHLFWTAASLTAGFLLAGFLADRLERIGIGLSTSFFFLAFAFMASQVPIVLQWNPAALWPWVIFALTGNGTAIMFAMLSRHFPSGLSGRASTAMNLLIFAGAFAMQYAVGAVIEFFPATAEGMGSPRGYQAAMGAFLALQVAGAVWYLATARWAPAEARP